jgi:hypothetical protein
MNWQLSNDRTNWNNFDAAGVADCELHFVACGVDTADLTVSGDYLASALAAYGTTLYLRDDTCVQRFIGRVTGLPRLAQGRQEHYKVQLSGGWWWIDRVSAQQRWTTRSPAAADYARFIVGQDATGLPITLGASIETALRRAIDRGAAIAVGSIAAIGTLPAFEVSNQRCADIILAGLRYFPDYIVSWDYSGTVPAISITAPGAISATTVDLSVTPPTDLQLAPRYGDQAPGVRVIYEISTQTTDDETGETTVAQDHVVDVAGSANDPLAVEVVFPLRGPFTRRALVESLSQTIVVDPIYIFRKSFWKDIFFGSLGAIADADWTLDAADAPSFRYFSRLTSGAITSWMAEDFGHGVDLGTWVITVTILRRDGDGNIVSSSKRRLACKFWSTNANSGTYTRERYEEVPEDPGDEVPAGLALSLYSSWNRLLYDGRVSWVGNRYYSLRMRLNLSNGRADWAAMAANVRQIDYNVGADACTLTLGPAARIEAEAALAISRGVRSFRKPEVKRTEDPADSDAWVVGSTLATSEQVLGEGDSGILSRLMLIHADGQSVTLDTAVIANIDEESEDIPALSIQAIWEVVPTFDESGNLTNLAFRQRQALVGAPGADADVAVNDCVEVPE